MAHLKIKKADGSWDIIGGNPVELDDTLTQSDFAADAKAVGDAIKNIDVEVDTTLNQSGKAADAKAVGDALAGKQPTGDYALNSSLGTLATKNSIEKTDLASDVQTSLGKADTALQSYTETDPTVPAWAKAATKPTYTAAEVGITTTTSVTSGSSALVTSGGVYTALSNVEVDTSTLVKKSGDTMGGALIANATAVAALGTAQVRNIIIGTADISEVEGSLGEGDIYFQYEE